jgi:DnaJ-class molecular chaperone
MQYYVIKCAFCEGTGENPYFRQICPVCKGKGANRIAGKHMTCVDCHGSGRKSGTTLTCYSCAGLGIVPDVREILMEARREIGKARQMMEEEKAR